VDTKRLNNKEKGFIRGTLSPGFLSVLFLATLLSLPCPAIADWSPLIDRLVADGFDAPAMMDLFSRPEVKFQPRVMAIKLEELLRRADSKPAGSPSYNSKVVHKGYLKEKVINRAHAYLRENHELLDNIHGQYCVPKEVVVSILLLETRLGEFLGGSGAFNSLACMALCTDLETVRPYLSKKLIHPRNEDSARALCRQKSDWAYEELKALILYADRSGFDPLSLPGSIYGAIGLCQFMPSNIFSYGVDADQDGRIDLFTKADALHSMANYLREHGWKCSMDRSSQLQVILDYNKSFVYANTVLAVAEKLRVKPRVKQ